MVILRKAFSTLPIKHPSFLRSIKGDVVPYPKNAVNVYGERPIVAVGVEAVQMADETHPADILRNMAKKNSSATMKDTGWSLPPTGPCLWWSMKPFGEQMFRSKTEDYYIGCIGSEVISQALMENMFLADEDQEESIANSRAMTE